MKRHWTVHSEESDDPYSYLRLFNINSLCDTKEKESNPTESPEAEYDCRYGYKLF